MTLRIMLCYPKCHYVDWRKQALYAGCHYEECHYAACHYAECRYAECRYSECRYAECRGAIINTKYNILFYNLGS
jgi:hypothetical protein